MQVQLPPRVPIFLLIYVFYIAWPPLPARPDPIEEDARFPARLIDIDGNVLEIDRLAEEHNLVLVTLKAPWCPVCQVQLVRILRRLPELEACGVSFIVLSPGTPEELAAIRARTEFDFPFVADDGLAVAKSLGVAMTEDQILPCMLEIRPDRAIGWRQLGRSGVYFGDRELSEYFDCSRFV